MDDRQVAQMLKTMHRMERRIAELERRLANQPVRTTVGGNAFSLPDGSADYQVLSWNNTSKLWFPDWPRLHA